VSALYLRAVAHRMFPDDNTWSGVTWIGDFH
jgi:hypothetical protein